MPVSDRGARLVKDRGGLFRALWSTSSGWKSREIRAVLTLEYSGGTSESLEDQRMISGPPDPSSIDGTFNWTLTAKQVKAGMKMSVAL